MKFSLVRNRGIVIILAVVLGIGLSGCGSKKTKKIITVGSKNFTEQKILGEIMAIMIEKNTDLKVNKRLNLGGTMVCFYALKKGDIDIYAEYTGTGLVNILERKTQKKAEKVYNIVKKEFKKKFNLIWLKPFGFNNTYTLTMRKKQAEELNIENISDLTEYSDKLQAGFDGEFLQRPDGYKGLKKHYDLDFKQKPKQMYSGLMYKTLSKGAVDVIDGFATDGRIPAYNLVILKDNKNFFPPYYAAPLVRKAVLQNHPQIKKVLNKLAGSLTNKIMRELNYKVDKKEVPSSTVAKNFLRSKGLIK